MALAIGPVSPRMTPGENGEIGMARYIFLFTGLDSAGNDGLWVSNGTAAGTSELTGISGTGAGGFAPSGLTVFKSEVLFEGQDTAGNDGLWGTKGTGGSTSDPPGTGGSIP